MVSALVNTRSNLVENLIVADPAVDQVPDGYLLIAEPPAFVVIGSPYPFVAPIGLIPEEGML